MAWRHLPIILKHEEANGVEQVFKIPNFQISKCVEHTFPTFLKLTIIILNFPEITFVRIELAISWIFQSFLVPPKSRMIGFGSHGHVR